MTAATDAGQSGRRSWSGGTSSHDGVSPVSIEKHTAAICHWSLAGDGRQVPSDHSLGTAMKRKSGPSPGGISLAGIAHCQPMIQRRPIGVVQTVSGDMLP
jgi:hypothetical protein